MYVKKLRCWSAALLFAGALFFPPLSGLTRMQRAAQGDWSVFLPEGDSKELVKKSCFQCHDLARVVKLRGDREMWTDLIYSMVANGANFTNDDIEAMAKYLSEGLSNEKPPLNVPINLNTASPVTLRMLSPISRYVEEIVQLRNKGEKFTAPEDLTKIEGVTSDTVDRIKPFVSVR